METRQQIIHSARAAYMKYGVKSVSMDDLAKNLRISKKTIYEHFINKDALINAIIDNYIAEEKAFVDSAIAGSESAVEEMIHIARYVLTFLQELNPSVIYDLRKYHITAWSKIEKEHLGSIQQVIRDNIIRGQKQGVYRHEVNVDIVSELYVKNSKNLIIEMLGELAYEPSELFRQMVNTHMHSIMSQAGEIKYQSYLQTSEA